MSSSQNSSVHNTNAPSDATRPDVPVIGYPRLADFMSKAPETQIFRSFSQLNILNILRLQAELHDLERKLGADQQSNSNSNLSRSFWAMREDKTGGGDIQTALLQEIDQKLERYNTALLHMYQLRSVQSPRRQDMDSLLDYVRGVTGVNFLEYPERDMWPNWASKDYAERITEEYITTDPRASKRDYFSILLEGTLLSVYHRVRLWFQRGQEEEPPGELFTTYKARHLETISTSVAVALSSLLPGVAMLVLYHVQDMVHRIVLVLVFTTLFSAFLKIFTAARTAEIYAATAAFAAVVVVFIGSDNLKAEN